MLRRAAYPLIFLLTFAGVTSLVIRLDASRNSSFRAALREIKRTQYVDHPGAFDIVFVGSSHILRNVNNTAFEARLAERGFRAETFNYGIPGARGHEIDYLIRSEILGKNPDRPKVIVTDVLPFDDYANRLPRIVDDHVLWHSIYQTVSSIQTVLKSPDLKDRIKHRRIRLHLTYLLLKYTSLGRGLDRHGERAVSPYDHYEKLFNYLASSGGYLPFSTGTMFGDITKERVEHLDKNKKQYLEDVRKLGTAAPKTKADYNLSAFEREVRHIRRAEVIPVYLTFPSLFDYSYVDLYEATGDAPQITRYDGSARLPWAYAIENRFDIGHLSDAGTGRFSEMLADLFVDDIFPRYPRLEAELREEASK